MVCTKKPQFPFTVDLNECEDYPNVCSDPAFFCCMDLPPPRKFICAPPLKEFVAGAAQTESHALVYPGFPGSVGPPTDPRLYNSGLHMRRENNRRLPENGVSALNLGPFSAMALRPWAPGTLQELAYQFTPPAVHGLTRNFMDFSAYAMDRIDEASRDSKPRHLTAIEDELKALRYPEISPSVLLREKAPRPDFFLGQSLAPPSAQCPAGFVNVNRMRQKQLVKRVPETATNALMALRNILPYADGETKIDPVAVAVGLATNANSLANQLAAWYKAFVALPEAMEGATSNFTSLPVRDDLEHALDASLAAVKPVAGVIDSIAQTVGQVAAARGSAPIVAPLANR